MKTMIIMVIAFIIAFGITSCVYQALALTSEVRDPKRPYLGGFDVDPDYYHENSHYSDSFVALGGGKSRSYSKGWFCNFYFPDTKEHWPHDHTYDIDGHVITIYCWDNDYNNKRSLVKETTGTFDETFDVLTIENVDYIRIGGLQSFPGTPIPVGAKK